MLKMLTPLERVYNLLVGLRYAKVDFDALFSGRNSLTPLESVELFRSACVFSSRIFCAENGPTDVV